MARDPTEKCWCGEIHDGPYGDYDWYHHHCFHQDPLVQLMKEDDDYFMCPLCGQTFWIERKGDNG